MSADAMRPDDELRSRADTPLSEDSGLCGGPGQLSCGEANELLLSYLDHVTDAEKDRLVSEHLGGCPPCETEFVVYQRIMSALERCRPDLPSDTKARLERFCVELSTSDHPLHGRPD